MHLENELLSQGVEQLQAGDYGAALELFDKAITQNPQQPDSWYQRGLALQKSGRYAEAAAANEKFMTLSRDLIKVDKVLENLDSSLLFDISQQVNLTNQWLDQGNQQFQLGNFEDALKSYDEALKCKSDCLEARFNQGIALRKLHRYEEAISSYDKILLFKSDDFNSWYDRGIALDNLNRHEKAILSFDTALELKSDFYQAWYGRGLALHDLGCNEEAISSYNKALKINSDFYQAWVNRGNALDNIRRHEEAIASYDKAVEIKLDFHTAWINRGIAVLSSSACDEFPALVVGATLISQLNPPLNQRGYSGQVITLEFGLTQVIPYSEGWFCLQVALGEAHFRRGNLEQQLGHNPSLYWQKARYCLDLALSVLSIEAFPELRLETLQLMIRVLLAQGDNLTAQVQRKEGVKLLETLLNQAPTILQKQQIEAEFSGFSQIEVDVWLQSGEPITALETAERFKNRCLTWILDAWKETVIFPNYAAIQSLCAPDTALIYWHLSSDNLSTFILTDKRNAPDILECNRASQAQQLSTWMKGWNEDYHDYSSQKFTGTEGENHPWRKNLVSRLDYLRQKILQIDTICQKIPDTVQNLILVPHRDLHLLPLHHLFRDHCCTYLPSVQIGLNLRERATENKTYTPLLSVEDPKTEQDPMHFAQLESAIIRHLIKSSTCISRNDSSIDTVLNKLKEPFATFHFTGHGAYNYRRPEDSGLVLTDSLLTTKTISQLNLFSYKLIVLASCETALTGNNDIKTEYVGLASAFLKAGAANVLSTLWQVDEISSAWLTIRFYQFLLTGDLPAVALRQAQQWLQTVTWQQLADWITQLSQLPELRQGRDMLTIRAKNTLMEGTIMGLDQPTKYSHPYLP
jgi:CHAT domain-containing protein/tetratricopeptide (TPR) repeat protein